MLVLVVRKLSSEKSGLQLQCLQPHLQMLSLSPDENVSGRSFSTPTSLQRPQRNTCRTSFAFFAWQRVKVRWENANVPMWVATKGRGARRRGEALAVQRSARGGGERCSALWRGVCCCPRTDPAEPRLLYLSSSCKMSAAEKKKSRQLPGPDPRAKSKCNKLEKMNTTGLSDCVYFLLNSRHSTAGGEADFPSFLVSFFRMIQGEGMQKVFLWVGFTSQSVNWRKWNVYRLPLDWGKRLWLTSCQDITEPNYFLPLAAFPLQAISIFIFPK